MCVDKKTIENSSYENIPAGQPNVNYSDIVEKGNIDLSKRPIVKNKDGSISTVRSMSFSDDGKTEILIPTVSDDGKIMSDKEAVDLYYKTGKHLGKFSNPESANKYAESLHTAQEKFYLKDNKNE
jgi:hypothetical protein